ncbi:MAG TPA: MBL fold metallo-hydrolase [Thermoanaerobaculia bacterium]|nr:MBL fold metallo-hydrolase [Thermoanaerobaculia bacterium]
MTEPRETRVRENVAVFTFGGGEMTTSWGANCTAIGGREATLLVDPLIAPAHARAVGDAVAERFAAPVRWVVLTHHHTDHALGASWFARKGATVVSHEQCRRGIETFHPGLIAERRRDRALAGLFADAECVPPALTFSDEIGIDLGGVRARVFHPGHGHTAGDAAVHVPEESVVVCGDLVSNGYHVNFEDASLSGFVAGLERLRALGAATYVPGHGAPGGREIVEAQEAYLAAIRELAREGGTEADLVERIRGAFPGFLLGMVLPDTARRFREG